MKIEMEGKDFRNMPLKKVAECIGQMNELGHEAHIEGKGDGNVNVVFTSRQ